jgi:L,D-peptidoglycan transpeptidase YkuD (ErfK/YbiS/YcfS/YnhG family)
VKPLLPVVLVVALLAAAPASPGATGATAAATGPAQRAAGGDTVTLDGVRVRLRSHTRQVVTVNRTRGWHARVTFWARKGGTWHQRFRARDGRIGYGGLVPRRRREQGSGKTPLGTFRMPWAFGMHDQRDRWDPSYRRARKGSFWVLDNESDHYNRYRRRSRGGFRWWLDPGHPDASERLRDYPEQYEFSFVTSFNRAQVRHRGGAIFLHVNGSGATAGCVSAPRWFLRRLMFRVHQDRVPMIAIGR